MNKIYEIFNGLEKSCMKWDGYFDVYEEHFAKYIGQNANILEIGVAQGGSLEMWAKYLQNPNIYGIDLYPGIVDYKYDYPNIHLIVGDQGNPSFWDEFTSNDRLYDIIIDDGSHKQMDQTYTLVRLFSKLKHDGVYIVEDTHTSYWQEKFNNVYDGGFKRPGTFIENVKDFADLLHVQFFDEKLIEPILTQTFKDLYSITFYNSMVVLKKKPYEKIVPLLSDKGPVPGWSK